MTAFDYAKTAQTALRLIERFGQTGAVRVKGSTGPAHNPTPTPPTDHPARIVITNFEAKDIDGTRVLATDKKALVAAAGLAVEPSPAHLLLEEDGKSFTIVAVETLKPATTPVVYTCQVRR